MNIDKVTEAIEQDAGMKIVGLKDSLREMQEGKAERIYTTPEQLLVYSARQKLNLSQTAFAKLIDTPVGTLRDWEQGRFKPPGSVLFLFKLIKKRPDVVEELTA